MTLRVLKKTVGPQSRRRPLPKLKKRKRPRWMFALFVLAALFYIGLLFYWVKAHYWSASIDPEPVVAEAPAEVVEPPIVVAEPAYPDLREALFDEMLNMGDFGNFDPRFSMAKYDEGVAFAKSTGLDDQLAIDRLKGLPRSATISPNCSLALVVSRFEPPVYWLDVSVTDPSGRFVSGLGRIDFDILQGTRRLHRVAVSESIKNGQAADIGILLDISGSTTGNPFSKAIAAAEDFAKQNITRSRIKIWTFGSEVRAETRWTDNLADLTTVFRRLKPDGGTSLNRAIAEAVDDASWLDKPAVLVVFTDGSDSFNNFPLQPAIEKAKHLQIPIHVVALKTGETKEPILKHIAQETSGSYHLVERPEGLLQEFRNVAEKLSTQVYRLAITESLDKTKPLSVQVGNLPPLIVKWN